MKMRVFLLFVGACLASSLVAQKAEDDDAKAAAGEEAKAEEVDPYTLPPPDTEAEIDPERLEEFEKTNNAGQVVLRYSYYLDEFGRKIKHGAYTEFYDDGTRAREVTYRHNLPHGRQRWWHPNGTLWMDFRTNMGKRDGTYQEFFRNGKRKRMIVYEDGKIVRRR